MRVATSKLITTIGAIGSIAVIVWMLRATKNGPITLERWQGALVVTPFAMYFGGFLAWCHRSLFANQRSVFVNAAYWLLVVIVTVIFIGIYGMVLNTREI